MSVVEHLDELRTRLIVSLAVFILMSVLAFIFYDPLFNFIIKPLCTLPPEKLGPQGCKLVQTTPMEGFQVRLKLTAMVGLILASPVWLYQLWAFIVPGLKKSEKRYALPFVASSVILFLIGATFAYLLLPTGLRVLISLGGNDLVAFLRADGYINFVGLMLIAFGVTFELPLVLLFLGLAGVISVDTLRRHRKAAIVGIAAIAAVVTPSQDPYTMLAMAIPLWLLYEVTIVLLRFLTRNRPKD
ncbi:MAG: sec-independent protein translocase protein TatC [Actinomycetota bacterium]|nr:sec-independent protein translocase protein TatC [Actinomycetota bacterium]